jgi:hypothetical protein
VSRSLHARHDAEEIPSPDLGDIDGGDSLAEQFDSNIDQLVRGATTGEHLPLVAIEVGTEADVIYTGDAGDVLDVPHGIADRGLTAGR